VASWSSPPAHPSSAEPSPSQGLAMMRGTIVAILFSAVSSKYVDDDGKVFCGGSTWNDPKASMLHDLVPGDESCDMLPFYDYDEVLNTSRTTWYQDRALFGERNSARVAAWEAQNLVCDDEKTDELYLPKKVGRLVWNHLGGVTGNQWGKCQEEDTTNECRGGANGCPTVNGKSKCNVPCTANSGDMRCRQPGEFVNEEDYCAEYDAGCSAFSTMQYIQVDDVGTVNDQPLSFRVTNLESTIGVEGPYNPKGKLIQTLGGESQTMMQGAALQINLGPDSAARFKYEFILTATEQQPAKAIWPICFTFYDFDQWGGDNKAGVAREEISVTPKNNGLFLSTWYKVHTQTYLKYLETEGASMISVDDSIMEYELSYNANGNKLTALSQRIGYGRYKNMEGFCCQMHPKDMDVANQGAASVHPPGSVPFAMCGNTSTTFNGVTTKMPEEAWTRSLDFGWETGTADRFMYPWLLQPLYDGYPFDAETKSMEHFFIVPTVLGAGRCDDGQPQLLPEFLSNITALGDSEGTTDYALTEQQQRRSNKMCFVNTYEIEVTYSTKNTDPLNCGLEGGIFDKPVDTDPQYTYTYKTWNGNTYDTDKTLYPIIQQECGVDNGRNFLVSWNALEAKTKACKTCDDVCDKKGCIALCEAGCDKCTPGCPTGCTPGCTPYGFRPEDEDCTSLCETSNCAGCFPVGPCTPGCTSACDPDCVEPTSGSGSGSDDENLCIDDCIEGCDGTVKTYEVMNKNYTSRCLPGVDSVPGCVDTIANPTCASEEGCTVDCVDLCEPGCKPKCGELLYGCDAPVCEEGCSDQCDAGCTAGCDPNETPGCTASCTQAPCNGRSACVEACACVPDCKNSCAAGCFLGCTIGDPGCSQDCSLFGCVECHEHCVVQSDACEDGCTYECAPEGSCDPDCPAVCSMCVGTCDPDCEIGQLDVNGVMCTRDCQYRPGVCDDLVYQNLCANCNAKPCEDTPGCSPTCAYDCYEGSCDVVPPFPPPFPPPMPPPPLPPPFPPPFPPYVKQLRYDPQRYDPKRNDPKRHKH